MRYPKEILATCNFFHHSSLGALSNTLLIGENQFTIFFPGLCFMEEQAWTKKYKKDCIFLLAPIQLWTRLFMDISIYESQTEITETR